MKVKHKNKEKSICSGLEPQENGAQNSNTSEGDMNTMHIEDLLNSDVLPWHYISSYFPAFIGNASRAVGGYVKKGFYTAYMINLMVVIVYTFMYFFDRHRELKSKCSKYFESETKNYTVNLIQLSFDQKMGNDDTYLINNCYKMAR